MKNLINFIQEALERINVNDDMYEIYTNPVDIKNLKDMFTEYLDADDDVDQEERIRIIEDFFKDAKTVSVQSSTPDYWGFECEPNPDIEEEIEALDIVNNADWTAEDLQSVLIDGNIMYISSQTGSYMNGDYFDVKFTKTV